MPAIKALAESGVDIINAVIKEETLTHTAAYHDGAAVLKWLIDAGVDVNKQSSMRQYGSAYGC